MKMSQETEKSTDVRAGGPENTSDPRGLKQFSLIDKITDSDISK